MVGANGPVRGPHPVGPVNRKRKYRAGWWEKKNQTPRLVAGVRKRVILRRPALKALPNLSLNVSDALSATRAD